MSIRRRLTTPLRRWVEDRQQLRQAEKDRQQYGLAYLNWWKQGTTPDTWFYRFLQRPALRNLGLPPLSFISVFGRRGVVKQLSGTRIFFTGENLINYPIYQDHLLGQVDLSLGFAELSDENYLRFPLWLLDLFPPDADLAAIQQHLNSFETAGRDLPNRPGFACMVARHDKSGLRARLGSVFDAYGRVDYAGAWRNNTTTVLPPAYSEKLALLSNYRFNLCPENSDAPGYVTEKIWHALAAGCLPVYWGSGNRPEPEVINPKAVLTFDPEQPELLQKQLNLLLHNSSRLKEFANQAKFLPSAANVIYGYFTSLENKLQRFLDR